MNLLRLLAILFVLSASAFTVQATITNESNRVDQTGNGSNTVFAYNFKITDKTHLKVYVNGTLKTVDTDYTVSGVGEDAGGNVTFTTAPTNGHRIIILRDVPLTQATAYTQGGKFPAASHEAALDKLTMQVQQLKERLDRAPTLTPQNSVGLTPLALPGVQALSYLRWNSGGTALENAATVADGQTIPLPLPIAQGGTGQNTEALARQALDVPSNAEAVLDTFMDAKGDLIAASAADTPARLAVGSNDQVLLADSTQATGLKWGAYPSASTSVAGIAEIATQAEINAMTDTSRIVTANHNKIVLGTMQASTAGTSIDFTGIPAGVRHITIALVGVSTNGTDNLLIQLGDSGGIETTNYSGAGSAVQNAGATATANSTAGMLIVSASAANIMHGLATLQRVDSASSLWVMTYTGAHSSGTANQLSAATKTLTDELTQIRLTTTGGANTFDAGNVNISYER